MEQRVSSRKRSKTVAGVSELPKVAGPAIKSCVSDSRESVTKDGKHTAVKSADSDTLLAQLRPKSKGKKTKSESDKGEGKSRRKSRCVRLRGWVNAVARL